MVTVPDERKIRDMCRGRMETPHEVVVSGTVPDDRTLHNYPWGHKYVFEFVGRTPPGLSEYLVYPPALEDLGILELEKRGDMAGSFYVGLVFRKKGV